MELAGQRTKQNVVDQRRFAGTAHTGDGREHPQGDPHVEILEVVGPSATNDQLAFEGGATGSRGRNRPLGPEILAGQRAIPVGQQLGRGPLEDHVPTVLAGARSEVDQVVGRANGLLIVLDDHDGITQIPEAAEGIKQEPIVTLM